MFVLHAFHRNGCKTRVGGTVGKHEWSRLRVSNRTLSRRGSTFYDRLDCHASLVDRLVASAYLAGRSYEKSKTMICCLTAVCFCGWIVPHVMLNGGFIGATSLIRALFVIPMVALGVLLAREHSLAKLESKTQA